MFHRILNLNPPSTTFENNYEDPLKNESLSINRINGGNNHKSRQFLLK
jgi:hypothetical protein